jgi:hypothetical protein
LCPVACAMLWDEHRNLIVNQIRTLSHLINPHSYPFIVDSQTKSNYYYEYRAAEVLCFPWTDVQKVLQPPPRYKYPLLCCTFFRRSSRRRRHFDCEITGYEPIVAGVQRRVFSQSVCDILYALITVRSIRFSPVMLYLNKERQKGSLVQVEAILFLNFVSTVQFTLFSFVSLERPDTFCSAYFHTLKNKRQKT